MTMPAGSGGSAPTGGNQAPGSAPAGAGQAPGSSPAPGVNGGVGAPSSPPSWLEGVPEDLTGWVNEQGFKTPTDVIASQRGLMRLKGVPEKELLRLQDKWDENPELADPIYARLGRPEKPDGYEIPDVMVGEGDTNLAPDFRQWAFEAGLSSKQAKTLAGKYQSSLQAFATQRAEALALRDAQEETTLRSEWGPAFEENVGAGKRAYQTVAKAVGLEEKDVVALQQSLGYAKVMKLFASMGRALGEHEPVAGEPEMAFGVTPAVATKKADELTAELSNMNRSDPRYEGKMQEMIRYRHLATGEQIQDVLKPRS